MNTVPGLMDVEPLSAAVLLFCGVLMMVTGSVLVDDEGNVSWVSGQFIFGVILTLFSLFLGVISVF